MLSEPVAFSTFPLPLKILNDRRGAYGHTEENKTDLEKKITYPDAPLDRPKLTSYA
jgi:hypothetical protein